MRLVLFARRKRIVKHIAQQFDLPMSGETFALVGEQIQQAHCIDCGELYAHCETVCHQRCGECFDNYRAKIDAQDRDLFQE